MRRGGSVSRVCNITGGRPSSERAGEGFTMRAISIAHKAITDLLSKIRKLRKPVHLDLGRHKEMASLNSL